MNISAKILVSNRFSSEGSTTEIFVQREELENNWLKHVPQAHEFPFVSAKTVVLKQEPNKSLYTSHSCHLAPILPSHPWHIHDSMRKTTVLVIVEKRITKPVNNNNNNSNNNKNNKNNNYNNYNNNNNNKKNKSNNSNKNNNNNNTKNII